MIASTLLMYCLGTAQIALVLHVDLIAFFDQHAIEGGDTILNDQGNRFAWIQTMLQLLNVSIGVRFTLQSFRISVQHTDKRKAVFNWRRGCGVAHLGSLWAQ